MEGQLSQESVKNSNARGRRAAGDLIPWTISQHHLVRFKTPLKASNIFYALYLQDNNFPQLCGARIIRLAVHPQLQGKLSCLSIQI